jgi:phage terminase large subunit
MTCQQVRGFYCPWDPAVMASGAFLETHHDLCLSAGLPPHTPPGAVPSGPSRGAERWEALTSWRLTGTHDGQPLLPALESGLYEYLILLGGRAGGKSHEVAEALIDLCSRVKKRVVCGREFQTSIRDSSYALLVKKIKAHRSAGEWKITDTELRHKNGTLITFIGIARNPDSAKSLEGADLFWGEEAQTFSLTSLEILIPTIREHGSMLIFTANPRFADDPVPRLAMIESERPEALFYKVSCFEDNPHLYRSRLMNDLRKSFRSSPRFRHVWRGDLDRNSELRIINHKVGRPPVAARPKTFYGVDFGATDPTAFVRVHVWPAAALGLSEDEQGILYVDMEFHQPCKSNREIVKGVTTTCPELVEGRWELKADSADPKAIEELNAAGIPTRGAVKGPGSVEAGLRTIADHEVWISPECPEAIRAAENYRWKADRRGKALNVPDHAFSHLWDAVRYAIEGEDLSSSNGVDYIILGELTA